MHITFSQTVDTRHSKKIVTKLGLNPENKKIDFKNLDRRISKMLEVYLHPNGLPSKPSSILDTLKKRIEQLFSCSRKKTTKESKSPNSSLSSETKIPYLLDHNLREDLESQTAIAQDIWNKYHSLSKFSIKSCASTMSDEEQKALAIGLLTQSLKELFTALQAPIEIEKQRELIEKAKCIDNVSYKGPSWLETAYKSLEEELTQEILKNRINPKHRFLLEAQYKAFAQAWKEGAFPLIPKNQTPKDELTNNNLLPIYLKNRSVKSNWIRHVLIPQLAGYDPELAKVCRYSLNVISHARHKAKQMCPEDQLQQLHTFILDTIEKKQAIMGLQLPVTPSDKHFKAEKHLTRADRFLQGLGDRIIKKFGKLYEEVMFDGSERNIPELEVQYKGSENKWHTTPCPWVFNGVGASEEVCLRNASFFHYLVNGRQVGAVYMPSRGLEQDIYSVCALKLGNGELRTENSRALQALLKKDAIERKNSGNLEPRTVLFHSRAAEEAYWAFMDEDFKDYRNMFRVVTVGGPRQFTTDMCPDSLNLVCTLDPVSQMDRIGLRKRQHNEAHTVHCKAMHKRLDKNHWFSGDTYKDMLRQIADQLIRHDKATGLKVESVA